MEFEVLEEHVWSKSDSLIKLANRFYNNSTMWWTIGIINGKPTDAHYKIGILFIPLKPNKIVESMR